MGGFVFLNKKRKLKYLRSIWGKYIEKYRNLDLIASYHNLLKEKEKNNYVDDKTWDDLNFDSIFSKIDRNISGIGQQFLYHSLHKYENDTDILRKKFDTISVLKTDRELREKIQMNLFRISNITSYFIPHLLLDKSIPYAKFYPLFYLCSFVSLVSLLLIPFEGIFLFIAIGILLTNLILNKIFSNKIYKYFAGFSGLNSLIISAISLCKIRTNNDIRELKSLQQKNGLLNSLKKKLGYFVIDKESLNELAVVIIEYLNLFLLFDIIAYYRSVNTLLKHQDEIHTVYQDVAKLDIYISIASYLEETGTFSNPEFNETGIIGFDNLYHPLINDAVPNTLNNLKNSALITGSNMAGKTTFIKTIGINFILSQTFYFCLAVRLTIPKYIVKAAIKREENLVDGKSYFFTEIEQLKHFIELSEEDHKYLFLIDEIFRGTNTIERLASSTAVLKYLDMKNRVLVTTHDIELQESLDDNFKMYHFSEQVENDKYFFNYKIQEGPCSSGNAVKLLEIMNYPASVTKEAKMIVEKLSQNNDNKRK